MTYAPLPPVPPPPDPAKPPGRLWIVAVALVATVVLVVVVVFALSAIGDRSDVSARDGDDGPPVHSAELVVAAGDGTQVAVHLDVYRGVRTEERVCGLAPDRTLVIPVRLSVENRSTFSASGSAGLGVLFQHADLTVAPRCIGVESLALGALPPGERRHQRYLIAVQGYYTPAEPGGSAAARAATVYVSGPSGYRLVSSSGGAEARDVLGSASFDVPLAAAFPQ